MWTVYLLFASAGAGIRYIVLSFLLYVQFFENQTILRQPICTVSSTSLVELLNAQISAIPDPSLSAVAFASNIREFRPIGLTLLIPEN